MAPAPTWNYPYFAVDPNTWLQLETKTANADPTLQSYYAPSNLYKWCSDEVPGDPHSAMNPTLARVISTTVIQTLSVDADTNREVWWNGELTYFGLGSLARHRFHGVLTSRDTDDPWHSPARLTLVIPKYSPTSYHRFSFIEIEGPSIPTYYNEGAGLGDWFEASDGPDKTKISALRTTFGGDLGEASPWVVFLTPGYHCLKGI